MIIHALYGGFPLCGFSQDVPVNWPDGHRWTYPEDIENITCPGCKQEAMRLKEEAGKQVQARPSRGRQPYLPL